MLETASLGHVCFLLGDGSHRIVIDPFLSGNPVAAGFLNAKTVIPMHDNTCDLIAQDADAFARTLPPGCKEIVLKVGEAYSLA